ncbi:MULTISPECIES: SH3 domain-containing protein [Pseudoalteromonas]|uniref:SH3 domain-containing protein n=1 Tax=Pseudoalteromonas TaxID=53246 RepID=UPI0002D30E92|nr:MULTISPECIES: SH3 domain-containing protein [Pseudoalteromonas]MCF6146740.1 hypothetical protein [Pseudoalteromonas mariniglutinosa NCIMB 1770]
MKLISLAVFSIVLSGCQLTQLIDDPGSMTRQVQNNHRDAIDQLSNKLDNWFTSSSQQQLLTDAKRSLNDGSGTVYQGVDKYTASRWQLHSDELQWQALQIKRPGDPRLDFAEPLQFIGLAYYTVEDVTLHSAAANDATVVTTLKAKSTFIALGKDSTQQWLLVQQDNQVLGYMRASAAKASVSDKTILAARPLPLKADTANDLSRNDTVLPMHSILGFYGCKNLTLNLAKAEKQLERIFTLCQKSPQIWFLDPLADS